MRYCWGNQPTRTIEFITEDSCIFKEHTKIERIVLWGKGGEYYVMLEE